MQFGASHPAALSGRLSTFGLVIALHLLIVLGLSAGLVKEVLKTSAPPAEVEVLKPEPPPVVEPVKLPTEAAPPMPLLPPVPLPEPVQIFEAPPISVRAMEATESFRAEPGGAAASVVEQPSIQATSPVSAGLLCPTQQRPELPALAQSGSAHLRVLGTVRGGRVVAVQMNVLQALPDRRAQRALLSGVEQTLRSGYACTQDGQFEQEFLFRVVE